MTSKPIEIPAAWEQIDAAALRGTLLVIGQPDSGKSTFTGYLVERLQAAGVLTAQLDGDPGQSRLGPPSTLTLVYSGPAKEPGEARKDAAGDRAADREPMAPGWRRWRSFVGAVTPVGHMLEMVTGGVRLVNAAYRAGAEAVVYDTCGLVDPRAGGVALKKAKIDLLNPTVVFAIQRRDELQPLLAPLRLSQRTQIIELKPAASARQRARSLRQGRRARLFARYFAGAQRLDVDWSRLGVFPYPHFWEGRLAALEDSQGFTLGLGIVEQDNPARRQVTLLTPCHSLRGITALHLGDLQVDPATFRDTARSV